ncbi:MAG: Ni/Fe-hydrogenase cytochrome b subunit [Deltaproteobacteria bacterium]|nr:Ni/Fe-hydrogenase cytochrome b subunit [Deltaproteobacteria bacterium]
MDRVRITKLILWLITGFTLPIFGFRFLFGLGASTNLTDAQPWGMWIGFDLLSGVALAAGGFVVCAFAYVMKKDLYKPIVRPAVLTAFLGYLAFIAGLLLDVGLPWTIWHVMIHWNLQSALFEVAWCVMLYTTVLALEFLPVPLESTSRFAKVRSFLVKIRLPLVILGIMLSTLHQSSLGSLFLIMPHRVYPLWYSPLIPILFFISAIGLGLMVVIFEGLVSHTLYRRGPQTELYDKLGNIARWVLGVSFGLRLIDLILRGQSAYLVAWDWRTLVFWLEMALSAIVPVILLSVPAIRRSGRWQWVTSVMVIVGIVWNRMNIGGFTNIDRGTDFYVPAWTEVAMSIGIISAFGLVFLFAVERFNIWKERPKDPMDDPEAKPHFDPVSRVCLDGSSFSARMNYSLAFILAAALGFATVSADATTGMKPAPAGPARGELVEDLWIDGNHDGFGTVFPHRMHEEKNGGNDSCVLCHHMNLPRDKHSSCAACHYDMYRSVDAFRHDWHASPEGGNLRCDQCHTKFLAKREENAARCDVCHKDLVPEGTKIEVKQYMAPSYVDAMHRGCISCHREKAALLKKPDLFRCANCHRDIRHFIDDENLAKQRQKLMGKTVILPPIEE